MYATTNRHLCRSRKRNGEQRRTKISFEMLRLAKGMSRDKAMLNSEEIKPMALVVTKLHSSEGISQSGSQSVEKSVK